MLVYSFSYLLDGETLYTAKHEFADDLDALDIAERLSLDFEIEIHQGERYVARVNKGRLLSNVHDARPG